MNRNSILLFAIAVLLAAGLVANLAFRQSPGITPDEVRAIVSEMLSAEPSEPLTPSTSAIDPATIHPIIESYLRSNPGILDDMAQALQTQRRLAQAETNRLALASMHEQIYNDPNQAVIGNPDGDVTLVEMYDYNCGYCRSAVPDLATLIADDANLRVVLKELPILSKGSEEAARIGIAALRAGVDYWAFHSTLFTARGQVDEAAAIAVATSLGLNPVELKLDAGSGEVTAILQTSFDIAQALKVSGTPTYIIGDEIIPGAIGLDGLRQRIANMRACGKTACKG